MRCGHTEVMQSRAAVRRRRIGQTLMALGVASAVGTPFLLGAFDVSLPLPVTMGVSLALLLVGMSFIFRGDRFYDRGFDGVDDAGMPVDEHPSTDGPTVR